MVAPEGPTLSVGTMAAKRGCNVSRSPGSRCLKRARIGMRPPPKPVEAWTSGHRTTCVLTHSAEERKRTDNEADLRGPLHRVAPRRANSMVARSDKNSTHEAGYTTAAGGGPTALAMDSETLRAALV
jgi:hypothetical protein